MADSSPGAWMFDEPYLSAALAPVDACGRADELQPVVHFGNVTNGWSSTAAYPAFGDDFWFGATANFGGIWWNSSKEAVYELLHVDADGEPITGDRTYRMTFPADALRGDVVDGFWSLTFTGNWTTCWCRTPPADTPSAPAGRSTPKTTARSP